MWWSFTGTVAALIVAVDVLQSFNMPLNVRIKSPVWYWVLSFVGINSALAVSLHCAFFDNAAIGGLPPWMKSLCIGTGYPMILNIKLASIKIKGQDVPIGLEWFHKTLKDYMHRHINREIIKHNYSKASRMANAHTVKDLAARASFFIDTHKIMTLEEKTEAKVWVLDVITDPNSQEFQRKLLLAHFINSGERPSR